MSVGQSKTMNFRDQRFNVSSVRKKFMAFETFAIRLTVST